MPLISKPFLQEKKKVLLYRMLQLNKNKEYMHTNSFINCKLESVYLLYFKKKEVRIWRDQIQPLSLKQQ
jgi:hypothetical protein